MNIEGKLYIDLQRQPSGLNVTIRSERPVLISRLFEGKPVNDILTMVPLLFNICGRAQSIAAARAIESAQGICVAVELEARRDAWVALENLREHLWRILIDWPPLLGAESNINVMAPLNQSLNALMKNLHPEANNPDQRGWHAVHDRVQSLVDSRRLHTQIDTNLTQHGWNNLGETPLHGLKELAATELKQILWSDHSEAFVGQPLWQQQAHETGPMSRQQHHPEVQQTIARNGTGLAARLTARLAEIEPLLKQISAGLKGQHRQNNPPAEHGIAQLETARGRLIHAVEVHDGLITHYRIVAPTEWNFHPQGAAASALSTLNEPNDRLLENQAKLLIHSIDPCVGFELTVR